jgi:hypothetical protein
MKLKSFNQFILEQYLTEGGWASSKTQSTIIRPKIIKDCVEKLKDLESKFNKHLEEKGMQPMEFLRAVGSGKWFEKDIESQPDKVYGDIDFNVSYPVIEDDKLSERDNEIKSIKLYNTELLSFLEKENLDYIDVEETKGASDTSSVKLIMKAETDEGEGWVQVDLIVTHEQYKDWSTFRLTPMHNVKGFVLGNLYSSFGEVLEINIQTRGVRAKMIDDRVVNYSKRSGAVDKLITSDVNRFMHDIAKFLWEQGDTDEPFKESESLKNWKGMDQDNPRIEDLAQGIMAVADTLAQLGEFGTTIKYKSRNEFIDAVKRRYTEKMETAASSTKFDKAETEQAKQAALKVKKLSAEYIDKVNKILN